MYKNVNNDSVSMDKVSSAKSTDMPNKASSWYLSMAKSWGNALDKQADKLAEVSKNIGESSSPGDAIKIAAQAHLLSFMANAASTANNSAGQALEVLGRKQ